SATTKGRKEFTMRPTPILLSFLLLISLVDVAHTQNGCTRLSWGSCDPWQENNCWQGPGYYHVVYSVYGPGRPILGTDSQIHVQPLNRTQHCYGQFSDAWRFGSGQCEGTNRLTISRQSINAGCPTLEGANDTLITDYGWSERFDDGELY